MNFSLISKFYIDRSSRLFAKIEAPCPFSHASFSGSHTYSVSAAEPLCLAGTPPLRRTLLQHRRSSLARHAASPVFDCTRSGSAAQPLSPSASQACCRFAGRCYSIAGGSQACSRFGTLPQHCVFARHLSKACKCVHAAKCFAKLIRSTAEPLCLAGTPSLRRTASASREARKPPLSLSTSQARRHFAGRCYRIACSPDT